VLNCIEFALFGSSELDRTELLRRGEDRGEVKLYFKIGDRSCWIKRVLSRRGKRVELEDTVLWNGEKELHLKIIDSRKEVFNMLNIKDNPNSQTPPSLFRYSIYTPQEQVKQILEARPEERLKILRQAFRIEDYERVLENLEGVKREIRDRINELKGATQDFEKEKVKLSTEEEEAEKLEKQIASYNSELEHLTKELDSARAERDRVNKELQEYRNLEEKKKELEKFIEYIEKDLEADCKKLKKLIIKVENLHEVLRKKEEELRQLNEGLVIQKLEQRLSEIERDRKAKQEELSGLNKLREDYTEKEKQLIERESRLNSLRKEIKQLDSKREEIEREIKVREDQLAQLEDPGQSAEEIAREIHKQEMQWDEVNKQSIVLSQKIKDKQKLIDEKVCPTCGQVTDSPDFKKQLEQLQTEHAELAAKLKTLADTIEMLKVKRDTAQKINLLKGEKAQLEKQLENADTKNLHNEISILNTEIEQLNQYLRSNKDKISEIEKKQSVVDQLKDEETRTIRQLDKLKNTQNRLEQELESLRNELSDAKTSLKETEKQINNREKNKQQLEDELEKIQKKLENEEKVDLKMQQIEGKISRLDEAIHQKNSYAKKLEGMLDEKRKTIQNMKLKLESLEQKKEKMNRMHEVLGWIDNYYAPAVKKIEKRVMERIHARFNQLFQKWFGLLIESEEFIAKIDEDFSPVIEQDGYDIPVSTLSGGEKTCVAMSYRFALNQIVKMINSSMESGLMILDEPTDGFSRDQIFRLRDVFEDLNCRQVIMVSHEAEMEDLVDNVIHIKKAMGLSKVVKA